MIVYCIQCIVRNFTWHLHNWYHTQIIICLFHLVTLHVTKCYDNLNSVTQTSHNKRVMWHSCHTIKAQDYRKLTTYPPVGGWPISEDPPTFLWPPYWRVTAGDPDSCYPVLFPPSTPCTGATPQYRATPWGYMTYPHFVRAPGHVTLTPPPTEFGCRRGRVRPLEIVSAGWPHAVGHTLKHVCMCTMIVLFLYTR